MNQVVLGILTVSSVFLAFQVKEIHWTDARAANKQMLLQFCIYTVGYCLIVVNHWVLKDGLFCYFYIGLVVGYSLLTLFKLCVKANDGNKIPVIRETAKPILKIVAFTWYGIFGSLCCVNYMLVVLFPGYYGGLEGMSFIERAFNVVYYTFSVMFTYAGNGITATGILSRSIEMIEILCCYVVIGIVIANSVGKATEKV